MAILDVYPNFILTQILFVQNIHFVYQIILKIRTEYGSDTAVLCAKFLKRFPNWEISYGKSSFQEIWVAGAFRTDILYYNNPLFVIQPTDNNKHRVIVKMSLWSIEMLKYTWTELESIVGNLMQLFRIVWGIKIFDSLSSLVMYG